MKKLILLSLLGLTATAQAGLGEFSLDVKEALSLARDSQADAAPPVSGRAVRSRTLRVGAGRPYATIDAALAAAQDGDVILVDPGTYPPFTINGKAVTILSSGGASAPFTVAQGPASAAVTVQALLPAQTAAIHHLNCAFTDGRAPAVRLSRCAGGVRLSDSRVDLPVDQHNAAARAAVEASDCRSVVMTNVDVGGVSPRLGSVAVPAGPPIAGNNGLCGVLAVRTNLLLDGVYFQAFDNYTPTAGLAHGGDGLRLEDASDAWFLVNQGGRQNEIHAGSAADFGGNSIHHVNRPGNEFLVASGRLLLRRGAGRTYADRGGFLAYNGDRGFFTQGMASYERFVQGQTIDDASWLMLDRPLLQTATQAQLNLYSWSTRPYVLFLGTELDYNAIPGVFGRLLLSPRGTMIVVSSGISSMGGRTVTLPVPNDPALIGQPAGFQALMAPWPGGVWSVSPPTFGVVAQ